MGPITDEHITIIPAAPGWFVLHLCLDRDGKQGEFWPDPVIAWRIESWRHANEDYQSMAHAVCESSELDGAEDILRRPDGHIVFCGMCDFPPDDEKEALAYALKCQAERAERRGSKVDKEKKVGA